MVKRLKIDLMGDSRKQHDNVGSLITKTEIRSLRSHEINRPNGSPPFLTTNSRISRLIKLNPRIPANPQRLILDYVCSQFKNNIISPQMLYEQNKIKIQSQIMRVKALCD